MATPPPLGYAGSIAAIRCGVGGLAVSRNPSAILLSNVIQAEGAVFRDNNWRKEPGTSLFGSNMQAVSPGADAVVVAMDDWHPTEIIQRLVHLRGDGYLYFTDNGGTDPGFARGAITSGAGTRFGFFVTGGSETGASNRKLFLFRNNKLPTYLDGDVLTDAVIPKPAADWSNAHPPVVGIVNGDRLFAAGNVNNPHALYASKFGDQTDFQTTAGVSTDTQVLSIFPGVGERIYALRNYQGFIVVFKYPRGIFIQDARDPDPINWLTQQVTDVIGVPQTPYAALQLENDVLFVGSDGQIYLLSAVIRSAATGQQNLETANLAMDLQIYQFLLSAYNRGLLGQMQSVYQPFWQTATFSIPSPGSVTNNTRFMLDFVSVNQQGGAPRFSYSYRDQAAALCLRRDPVDFIDKPMFGDYSSNFVLLEQEDRTTWNGAAYPFRVQTPHTNLGQFEVLTYDKFAQFANRVKNFDNVEIEYEPLTAATVTLTIFVDGIFRGPIIPCVLTLGGDVLGNLPTDPDSFTLGTSLLAGGGFVRSLVKALKIGSGRRISLLFENLNYGEDVAITHLFLGFRSGDTTQTPRT